jgi:hypothetical protein
VHVACNPINQPHVRMRMGKSFVAATPNVLAVSRYLVILSSQSAR